jgi:hypothetical protein
VNDGGESCDVYIKLHDTGESIIDIDYICDEKCGLLVDVFDAFSLKDYLVYASEQAQKASKHNAKYIYINLFPLISEQTDDKTWVLNCLNKLLKDETLELGDCNQECSFLDKFEAASQIITLCDNAFNKQDFTYDVYDISSSDFRPLKDFVDVMKSQTH